MPVRVSKRFDKRTMEANNLQTVNTAVFWRIRKFFIENRKISVKTLTKRSLYHRQKLPRHIVVNIQNVFWRRFQRDYEVRQVSSLELKNTTLIPWPPAFILF